jgi:hypothetical protein
MTHAEWIAAATPGPLLRFVGGRPGDRKLRLFAYACCRSIQHLIPAGPCRTALEVSLRFAEGQATAAELAAARSAAVPAAAAAGRHAAAAWAATETANEAAEFAARTAAAEAAEQVRRINPAAAVEEEAAQAGFLRDIVGDPFGPSYGRYLRELAGGTEAEEIAAELATGAMAEQMEELAEALERLGRMPPSIVDHVRSPGPHVRGCWVLDLILGKHLAEPEPMEPLPVRIVPGTVAEVREALANFLGSRYQRFLRKAAGPGPGIVNVEQMRDWGEFLAAYPEVALTPAELNLVVSVCAVHCCELVARPWTRETGRRYYDHEFLQAQGTRFPYAHPPTHGPEGPRWWCPECQAARQAWEEWRAATGAPPG